nr:MAG: hypothetical protein [Bacteriophage sp.]
MIGIGNKDDDKNEKDYNNDDDKNEKDYNDDEKSKSNYEYEGDDSEYKNNKGSDNENNKGSDNENENSVY